jgi:hypothetical protein
MVVAGTLAGAAGPTIQRFTVGQVRQLSARIPAVRAYIDLVDADGKRLETLAPDSISATLGAATAELHGLEDFAGSGEGVAYVFLVDVSRSLSQALFDRILESLESWVSELDDVDRAAVLAFGETSRVVVDFTADKGKLKAGLRSLGPTDDQTLLHQSLVDALNLSRRRDPGLPGRRVLVVLRPPSTPSVTARSRIRRGDASTSTFCTDSPPTRVEHSSKPTGHSSPKLMRRFERLSAAFGLPTSPALLVRPMAAWFACRCSSPSTDASCRMARR